MKKSFRIATSVLLPLCAGLFIYLFFRPGNSFIRQWLHEVSSVFDSSFLPDLTYQYPLPRWIVYSLPDGLWMLSLTLVILAIWNFKLNRSSLLWIILAACAGLSFETCQAMHYIRGHFDLMDLVLILLAALIPLTYIRIKSWMHALKEG